LFSEIVPTTGKCYEKWIIYVISYNNSYSFIIYWYLLTIQSSATSYDEHDIRMPKQKS